ncbi:hypothetical protein SBOR_6154 [Sclerotinia borealis F-4128]|uniref:Uncharacterized protein n=1 Tax=Sclerotinia borealis (strain F-4128) TaxID=1432307 RepID=W9C9M0_SCLBF|nr:hypothetical protein SBOR_6154 [Sclerotinia borealis F-4128]
MDQDQTKRRRIGSAAFALVGSGTGCLSYGTGRYFAVLQALKKGMFRPNMGGVMLVTLTSGFVAAGGGDGAKETCELKRKLCLTCVQGTNELTE